ncbi:MAG: transglycosylase domain-containing protein [Cryomorphaceae bacterium]|nr:transglycosylase domain-containing protein [Cryomorphaceae bacterium]
MQKKKQPTPKKGQKKGNGKYVLIIWCIFFVLLTIPALIFYLASNDYFGELPGFEEIENPKSNLASQIISSDGVMIGKFYKENRTHVEFEQISPYVIDALVATEDERFFSHPGIDLRALARAVSKMGKGGGASTITQQLAKNLFHEPATSLIERLMQKTKEWVIAARLERQYTKEEIITMYLNQFDFIYQAVGIQSAAAIYFNQSADSLTLLESAMLVGMVKNPSLYSPITKPVQAVQRRNAVLYQMVRNNSLTREAFDTLKLKEIGLNYTRQGHDEGSAPYFREYVRSYMRKWSEENPKADGSKYNMYTDGLKIYTTIDTRMQQYAEEAVSEHMSNLQRVFFKVDGKKPGFPYSKLNQQQIDGIMTQAMRRSDRYRQMKRNGISEDSIREVFETPIRMHVFHWDGDIDTVMSPMDSIRYYKAFYRTGFIAVDPLTGFVKAYVGGMNFKHFKYDQVKMGRRQAGSTFKPFVYATAIKQKKYSPCFEVPDVLTCIEKGSYGLIKDWCPQNSNRQYGEVRTLRNALANSVNTITTFLMKQIGPEPVVRMVKAMGVEGEVPMQPSIALGTLDMSVYELAGAYTTFVNGGVYTQPLMITRIEDKNGTVLQEFSPFTREILNEQDAFVMLEILKGVTIHGTGARLRTKSGNYSYLNDVVTGFPYGFENPIAGKTGTTQNNSDGWFVGLVPNLVGVVWSGCEDRSAHFRGTAYGQGATVALPTWAIFMRKCYEDQRLNISKGNFPEPVDGVNVEVNCQKERLNEQSDPNNRLNNLGI